MAASHARPRIPPASPPLVIFGASWHHGTGSKDRMKNLVSSFSPPHECLLQLQDPESGARHFASYATWAEALSCLRRLRGHNSR
jgi:hypothetical protein